MESFRILLCSSTLLCSLVAGFLFAFAVVVMPGIKTLGHHDFVRSFQVMDRVIQNGQPLFGLVWLGSVITVVATAILGGVKLDGIDRLLVVAAAAVYLFGVQLPTMSVNVPLNNRLQELELASANEAAIREARESFEPRWIRWNAIRTGLAILVAAILIWLLARL